MDNINISEIGSAISSLEYKLDRDINKIVSLKYFIKDYDDKYGYIDINSIFIKDEKGEYYINTIKILIKENSRGELNLEFETKYPIILNRYIDQIEVLIEKVETGKIPLAIKKLTYENSNNKTDVHFSITLNLRCGVDICIGIPREQYIVNDRSLSLLFDNTETMLSRYETTYNSLTIFDFNDGTIESIKYDDNKTISSEILLKNIFSLENSVLNFIPNFNLFESVVLNEDTNIDLEYDYQGMLMHDSNNDVCRYSKDVTDSNVFIESLHRLYFDFFDFSQTYKDNKFAQDTLDFSKDGSIVYKRNIYEINRDNLDDFISNIKNIELINDQIDLNKNES